MLCRTPFWRMFPGLLLAGSWLAGCLAAALPEASWTNLPPWRGFNLLTKFHRDWSNRPFAESDFRFIAAHGFDFVRLPTDYRVYVSATNWTNFGATALADFDRAVDWGGRYGVHVCLNLHRIPGFTVASPPESTSLWTGDEARAAAAAHWRMWARRYRGVPNSRLSFNLLNEPGDVTPATYSNVVAGLVAAIRSEDPGRLVIADGLNYGRTPVPELIPLRVAQATRGYSPFGLTHYRAEWVAGSDAWPAPEWPTPMVNQYLYGPDKPEFRSSLRILGGFPEATTLRVRVGQVSARSRLALSADGRSLASRLFVPAAGAGEWQEVIYTPQWNIYQNRYDRDYSFTVPAGTTNLVIQNSEGDWMTVREYGFRPASWPTNREAVLVASDIDWGRRQTNPVTFLPGAPEPFRAAASQDRAWLWRDSIEPWLSLRARGVGVMVGEWGAHNRTPHVVTLAWMRSALENFELSGLGWALWNLDGSFGPVNGGRADVTYENYQGLRLDRKMFDLLREFTGGRETYPRWRDRMFRDRGEPPALQEPGASAVPGGPANYFRYATGTTFSGVDSGPAVRLSSVPGGLEVRFRRSRREVGSLLGIQESADLRSWTDLPDATPGTVGATHDTEWLARRVPDSPTPRFFRLKVTPPEPGATYSYGAP